jgi:hypothetical protein
VGLEPRFAASKGNGCPWHCICGMSIGQRVDAKVKGVNVLRHFESDFVGGFTGNSAQFSSSSPTLRIRQYVDLREDFWEVPVGEGWNKNAHEDAVGFDLRYVLPGTAPTVEY